jgi:hypothetical protein
MAGVVDRSDQDSPSWLQAALAEYEAHRAEVVAEGAAQQQILAFGAAAVGIVVAGAFNVWDDRGIAAVAFMGAVPLLSLLVLVQWAGRTAAMMRVGAYLEAIEGTLRGATSPPRPLLTWESALVAAAGERTLRPQAEWADASTVAIFGVIAVASTFVGLQRGWEDHRYLVVVAAAEVLAIVVVTIGIARGVAHVRRDARRRFHLPEAG